MKGGTARAANLILGRTGAFWERDYFDRYIRDETHLAAVMRYIEQNPVKAGLVASAQEWRYGSAAHGSAGSAGFSRPPGTPASAGSAFSPPTPAKAGAPMPAKAGAPVSRFILEATAIAGVTVLQRQPLGDARGYLERLFCQEELAAILAGRTIVQINHTLTAKAGTLRGLHFQHPPHAEMKLVSCLRGEVDDVALDQRADSPTFGRHHAEILSAENHRTLVIPEGCAHGFQTLTDDCELLYLHTAAFAPDAEGGVNALDPTLGIAWPLPVGERSARDRALPPFANG